MIIIKGEIEKMKRETNNNDLNNVIIEMPTGAIYISDYMTSLPRNCKFNKGITGAGGTTMALIDGFKTVICVPYISLIDNKVEQTKINKNGMYPHRVFGFYGDVTVEKLNEYLATCEIPKIIVTYDSLGRLADLINPAQYNLLIDEYHCLFMDYSFRPDACSLVLKNYVRFMSYTFMTATPIEDAFQLKELKKLKTVTLKWPSIQKTNVIPVKSGKSVLKTTINHIKKFINGDIKGNAYVFVNSIKFINQLVTNLHLTNDQVRVVCSVNSNDRLRNGILRSSTTDHPKKINLITRTGFEGCDIYDTEGKTIIVSDPYIEHTLLDIQIQVPQIIGRIRDSKYNGLVEHIHSNTRAYDEAKLTFDDLSNILSQGMREAELLIEVHNTDLTKASLKESVERRSTRPGMEYIKFDDQDIPSVDENRCQIALYRYKLLNTTYSTRKSMEEEYNKAGLKVHKWSSDYADFEVIPSGNFNSFKAAYQFAKEVMEKRFAGIPLVIEELQGEAECFTEYDYLKPAIVKLGYDYIENDAKFRTTNIKRKLISQKAVKAPEEIQRKIYEILVLGGRFKQFGFISCTEAKGLLEQAYCSIGFENTKITTSILNMFFNTEPKVKKINKKTVRGFVIIDHRFKSERLAA